MKTDKSIRKCIRQSFIHITMAIESVLVSIQELNMCTLDEGSNV